ncbi:SOS response-associated peptidase family protein [Faecalitalea cylindroides]|nr:SOS response-associated peptidase family protein [Faecalitalea cylindroides]
MYNCFGDTMCSSIKINPEDVKSLKEKFNIPFDIPTDTIKPNEKALVLYKEGKILPKLMSFGWNDKVFIINARQETLLEKPIFKKGKRCVIPASLFHEWSYAKEKVTFHSDNIMHLAGLYNQDNEFLIITTKSNDSVRRTHDRMPIILEHSQLEDWFNDTKFISLLWQEPKELEHEQKLEQLSLF